MGAAARRAVEFRCDECDCRATSEVWPSVCNGVPIQLVPGAPTWAIVWAVPGIESVTRHACPECGKEFAVLPVLSVTKSLQS